MTDPRSPFTLGNAVPCLGFLFVFVTWALSHKAQDALNRSGPVVDAAAELGRNPVSKHQIQPEYGDEKADAGRDCRTRLARPDSQA